MSPDYDGRDILVENVVDEVPDVVLLLTRRALTLLLRSATGHNSFQLIHFAHSALFVHFLLQGTYRASTTHNRQGVSFFSIVDVE